MQTQTEDFKKHLGPAGFYKPYKDHTNKIDYMRYLNNTISYGYNVKSNSFFLCVSPILETIIIRVISEHQAFDELQDAFYNYKEKYINQY